MTRPEVLRVEIVRTSTEPRRNVADSVGDRRNGVCSISTATNPLGTRADRDCADPYASPRLSARSVSDNALGADWAKQR
jgi:hypothetical protein